MTAEGQLRPVIFGEVLFDHFPDGSVVLGGAPFNVAWHLQAFGLRPVLVSRVGDDPLGRRIRNTMREWGMDTAGLQLDSAHPTGTVDVTIEEGEPAFDILAQRAYDYIDASQLPPLTAPPLLYHGSLALRNPVSRNALERMRADVEMPAFMDVNLRDPWWDRDFVLSLLKAARWAKLNAAELLSLTSHGEDLAARGRALQQNCDLELVIITQGAEGVLACLPYGETVQVPAERAERVADTVGAGDAFAAVTIFGLLAGWELGLALQRAQSFASAIVGIRGATPGERDFYTRFLDDRGLT